MILSVFLGFFPPNCKPLNSCSQVVILHFSLLGHDTGNLKAKELWFVEVLAAWLQEQTLGYAEII